MTRKDYEAIAKAIKANIEHGSLGQLAIDLADVCGRDNDKFDRHRFLKACGLAYVSNDTGVAVYEYK